MLLKNYTSDVPASVTINRIQNFLIKAGVMSLSMDYGVKGEITAITFKIQYDGDKRPVDIRLPANVEGAQHALFMDYADGESLNKDGTAVWGNGRKRKTRADFREQAERTAWRLVQDWIEVQLSMIAMKQADFVQVFLPYVWDGKQSFYARIKDSGFLALEGPKDL